MRPMPLPLLVLLCLGPMAARARAPLPAVPGRTLGSFQAACEADPAFKIFAKEVGCIEGLIAESSDPANQKSNPDVRLYTLTADKLVDDVNHHRTTAAAARVELQRTFIDIRQRELAEEESQSRMVAVRMEQQARDAEADRAAAEAEERQAEASASAASQFRHAVLACIANADARLDAQYEALTGMQRGTLSTSIGYQKQSAPQHCQENPNWYQTIAAPQPREVATDCAQIGNFLHCTSK